jgi:ribosome maturation factor RimP
MNAMPARAPHHKPHDRKPRPPQGIARGAGVPADRLSEIARPVVEGAGLDLIGLRVMPAPRGGAKVQLLIDRLPGEGAVSLDDCAEVSRKLLAVLETTGDDDLELEVSSPGMHRTLRHEADFARFVGVTAKVTLVAQAALDASRAPKMSIVGRIDGVHGGLVTLQPKLGVLQQVAITDVQAAHLHPTVDEWLALGERLRQQRRPGEPVVPNEE